jgi:uncharacterized membrane protein
MNASKLSLGLASAAAAIALATIAQAADTAAPVKGKSIHAKDDVHCFGVNSCKGQSDCHTATNDCKTLNSCKGTGFKTMSASRCFTKRGFIGDVF